ncbi:MAG: hypothetical protein ACRETL_10480, partial [Gammaproteobacteria bacterium]
RGPASVECIRVARTWTFTDREGRTQPLDMVIGNHENNYLYARRGWVLPFRDFVPTPDEKRVFEGLSDDDLDWIESLPFTIRIREDGLDLTAVHGGFMPWMKTPGWYGRRMGYLVSRIAYIGDYGKILSPMKTSPRFWAADYDGRFGEVFFGHTTHDRVNYYDHAVAVDVSKVGWVAAVVRSSDPGDDPYYEFYEEHGHSIIKHPLSLLASRS